ncbi:DNA-binding response regulator, partial [Escherichia coli]|nr:DNA-binding response regulator [Escherichia coli]
ADYLLKPVNPDELNAVLAKCKRDLEKVRYSPEGWEPYSRMFAGEFSRFQQQVRIRFNELNMPELRDLFNQLEEKLEKEDMRKPQQLGRVVHDLQTLLGELCSSNGAGEQSAAAKAAPPSALTTASAALAWTFDLYSQA